MSDKQLNIIPSRASKRSRRPNSFTSNAKKRTSFAIAGSDSDVIARFEENASMTFDMLNAEHSEAAREACVMWTSCVSSARRPTLVCLALSSSSHCALPCLLAAMLSLGEDHGCLNTNPRENSAGRRQAAAQAPLQAYRPMDPPEHQVPHVCILYLCAALFLAPLMLY